MFVTTNGKIWLPLHWKMIWVFTGCMSYCPESVFKISMFPFPLTSFVPFLCGVWSESTVCIGLSVPKQVLFLIHASFMCISDEKKKSALWFNEHKCVFLSKRFPPRFLMMLPLRARSFFMRGKWMWLLHFLGIFTYSFSSPELCSGWAIVITFRSCVHPSVNIFKRLLLWSRWANFAQISYGASIGWRNEILLKVAVSWPRWPPCPYMVKTFKNLFLQNRGCLVAVSLHKSSGMGGLPKLLK